MQIIIKLTCNISMSSNNLSKKMSKNFSANYYQNDKERLQKIARKRYRGLFKKEK